MSRINTNIPSLIATRILGQQTLSLSQSLERLSTGLRINSGKDDPAGLIASESLRAEATSINAAIENASRAGTVVATAEGALDEVSSLLTELQDLVVRSANEAGLSSDELAANQLQIDSILDSITRVANTTQFNGKKLLDGSLAYTLSGVDGADLTSARVNAAKLADGGSKTVVVQVTTAAETGRLYLSAAGLAANNAVTIEVAGRYGSDVFSFAGSTANAAIAQAVNQSRELTGVSATASANGRLYFNSTDFGSNAFVSVEALSGTFSVKDSGGTVTTRDAGADAAVTVNGTSATVDGLLATVQSSGLSATFRLSSTFGTTPGSTTFSVTGGGANFAISPTLTLAGRESLGFSSIATSSLGDQSIGVLSTLGSGQANALSASNFATAQRVVREAISQVATLRGRLGAFQKNTVETTIASLQVASENVLAAESAIRDTDFAQETSRLTRAQILLAAATQTLRLANQAPQSVLALLS
ncbi:MAG: flagellin [Phycisphaerae bacterium]|nr:flagellin [Phycisphaerae bacterium]